MTVDDLTSHLLTSLQHVSHQLVSQRLSVAPGSSFDPGPSFLAQVGPIFAALHQVNRDDLRELTRYRNETHQARLEMDVEHLRLQNLMFERNHLEREILACQQFESEYQHLPLLAEHDFIQLVQSSSEALPGLEEEGIKEKVLVDPHERMLARLGFELAERRRFDAEKKDLSTAKAALVKENERKKARLDELEHRVDQFVKTAKSIQATMHGEESMVKPSSVPVIQGEGAGAGTGGGNTPAAMSIEEDIV